MTKVINSIIKTNSQIKAVLLEFLFSKNPEIKSITASLKILSSTTVNTNLNKSFYCIFYQINAASERLLSKHDLFVSWCERTFRDGMILIFHSNVIHNICCSTVWQAATNMYSDDEKLTFFSFSHPRHSANTLSLRTICDPGPQNQS